MWNAQIWLISFAILASICGAAGAEREPVDPCEVNKDSSACMWSNYGEDWLDPPPRDGSDVLRVYSYVQAGPQNSTVVELRHVPSFGVFMTVRQPVDRRGRIFLRVPDATWDAAIASLGKFRAYTERIKLKEYEQPDCLDGDWLDIDTVMSGKPDHLHGYECEYGAAITFTTEMRKLVIASIPYCASAGTDDVSDCFALDGDKFLAAHVVKPLKMFHEGCDGKPEVSLSSILAKDVRLNMADRPVISGADTVAKSLRDLACPKAGRSVWNIGLEIFVRTVEGRDGIVFVSGDFNVRRENASPDLYHIVDGYDAPITLTWRRDVRGEFKVRDIQIGKLLLE